MREMRETYQARRDRLQGKPSRRWVTKAHICPDCARHIEMLLDYSRRAPVLIRIRCGCGEL